jgi:hypothetical protein
MRKLTRPGIFPATYRNGITQAISALPSSMGSAPVKFTNNDRSTSILNFPYVGLTPQYLSNTLTKPLFTKTLPMRNSTRSKTCA